MYVEITINAWFDDPYQPLFRWAYGHYSGDHYLQFENVYLSYN